MRAQVITDLSSNIDAKVVAELVEAFEQLVSEHRAGHLEQALTKGGRFVEHVLRAIEFLRTGKAPSEIKSVQQTILRIENDTTLPESLRLLIPRAANGMIYGLRSKRNAVHVNEIDPTPIDVALTVAAAGWIMAELLRLYHISNPVAVAQSMLALTRSSIPFVEAIDGEIFVGRRLPAATELMLLLAHARPYGMTRKDLGIAAKCSQPSVTTALQALQKSRLVHRSARESYFLTSFGEAALADLMLAAAA